MWYIIEMKSYITRWFNKWADKKGISESQLIEAIERTKQKLGIVDLGGNLFKIRIGKEGQGRSGGYRTILAVKLGKRALFIYGFEKNDKDNIDKKELEYYKEYAKTFLAYEEKEIERLIDTGVIIKLEEI